MAADTGNRAAVPSQAGASPQLVTGVVLAGGRASRMGGVDKGLQPFGDGTLASHAYLRLQPQVDAILISANRNLDRYRLLGTVLTDAAPAAPAALGVSAVAMGVDAVNAVGAAADSDAAASKTPFDGPLAGMLAALRLAQTAFVCAVPCDAPFFPSDLVMRLTAGLGHAEADIAIAATADGRSHPVFALMRTALADSLAQSLARGERRVRAWQARHRTVEVLFDDERAFYNINTLEALHEAAAR